MSSLFDRPEVWRAEPQKAFDSFVVSPRFQELSRRKQKQDLMGEPLSPPPLRASSARVYQAMFAKFLRWIGTQHIGLFDVSSDDLIAFLQQATGKSLIRLRYLRMLERVYQHLGLNPNPAQHASFVLLQIGGRAHVGRNDDKTTLTDAQQAAFMRALPEPSNWKRRRDRAMQAMMLGAGLKVSEVVGIYLENLGEKEPTGSIPITIKPASAGGTVREHRTQLRPFAVAEVVAWLRERHELRIPGPLLFPASRQGGRVDPATVYRQTKATFARAGIAVPRKGGRTLRNAFAIRELQTESIEHVGELLGHRQRRSTEYYVAAAERPMLKG
jgi:site-specific recombinase XerD